MINDLILGGYKIEFLDNLLNLIYPPVCAFCGKIDKNFLCENCKKEVLELIENERKRIAGELHDTTVQDLICLSQQLEIAYYYMDKDPIRAKLEVASSRKKIKDIINEIKFQYLFAKKLKKFLKKSKTAAKSVRGIDRFRCFRYVGVFIAI